jgi:hypothetical protein
MLAFGVSLSPASAHNGVVHDETSADSAKISHMKQVIAVLTQLVDLLKQKAALQGVVVAEVAEHHDEVDDEESDTLKIWVEVHSYKTHAHVQKPHESIEAYVLDGISYTNEAAIIAEISKKTGYSIHDIEEIITFPEGELNAKGDSVDEHDDDNDEDVTGIHIMSSGDIMWGNGTEVHGATITTEGKVKLSDGRIVTPKFDLR